MEVYDIFAALWKDGNFSRMIESSPLFVFFSFVVQTENDLRISHRRKLRAIVNHLCYVYAKLRFTV